MVKQPLRFLCPIVIVVLAGMACNRGHSTSREILSGGRIDTLARLCTCFQPPPQWKKFDSAALGAMINPGDKQRGSLHVESVAGYGPGSGPFCLVSALVDSTDRTFPVTGSKIQDYCIFVKESLQSAGTISIMQSQASDYVVTTLRIAAPGALIFKVVFFEEKGNKAFEADYILPAPSNSDTVLIHTLMNSALSFKPLEARG